MSDKIRDVIHQTSLANLLWGASRIHGEPLELGIRVSQLRWEIPTSSF